MTFTLFSYFTAKMACNLVNDVRYAFEVAALVEVDCGGFDACD